MGVDTNYMVAAYLLIEADDIVEQIPAMGCPDHDKELFIIDNLNQSETVFCKRCGKKYESKKITETHKPILWRLLEGREDLEDSLHDTHMYEHDERRTIIAYGHSEIDIGNIGVLEIVPQMATEHIEAFKKKNKDAIDYLRTKAKSVEVKFGALLYYS